MDLSEQNFKALIERNRPRLVRLCRVYARDEADRQDLFQEIVYQLWQALPHFRGEAQMDTFFYRVAVNTALTHQRRERRRATHSLDPATQSPRVDPDWAADLDQQEQLKALYAAIDQLPQADRTLVLLYLEELSYQEMAEVTGLSISNVGVRLNRIRKRLKTMMGAG